MGDSFNQNHSGSGHNFMNFGPRRPELTSQVLDEITAHMQPDRHRTIQVSWMGSGRSQEMAERLKAHLVAQGFKVEPEMTYFGMLAPPPTVPITLHSQGITNQENFEILVNADILVG